MSAEYINYICLTGMSIFGFYIINKITSKNIPFLCKRTILGLIFLSISSAILYRIQYLSIYSIAILSLNLISYGFIFNLRSEEALISNVILILLTFVGDLPTGLVIRHFYTVEEVRSIWYVFLLSNISVVLIEFLVIKIKFIKKQLCLFYKNFSNKKKLANIIYFILLALGIFNLSIDISKVNYEPIDYLVDITLSLIFILLTYFFISSRNSYQELAIEYDNLFNYMQNFEDWIEKEQLTRHEYKNQLAVLKLTTTDNKTKEKINTILNDFINVEGEVINSLKVLPKGGIKGLMYYKSSIAQKYNIDLVIDVSIKNNNILNNLSEKDNRIICKLIGIYFDNAIEAAIDTKNKKITIEIYGLKDNIIFVFSNTYNKKALLNNHHNKGVSSKGKGRGNGLYFANKLLEQNNWLENEQIILDKYYVQKLIIKKKRLKDVNRKGSS